MRLSKIFSYSLITLFLIFSLFGIFLSRYDISIRKDITLRNHPKFHDYRGATHVLSEHSQGSASVEEIANSANLANIDFLFITDLNDFNSINERRGYSQNVLLFTGKKISYLDSHFLLYGDKAFKKMDSLSSAQNVTNDFLNRIPTEVEKTTVVMAHPFKQGFQWNGPYPEGLNGIEVMNLRHMWQQFWSQKKASFISSLLIYIFNPHVALLRIVDPPTRELILWDNLNLKHRTLGLLGHHATGKLFSLGFISLAFPTYEDSFRFASNHILLNSELTGIESIDSEKILSAITNGHFYFSIDALAPPKGFAAYMLNSDGQVFSMGDTIPFSKNLKLIVNVPPVVVDDLETILIRNGEELTTLGKPNSEFDILQPGTYRIYVRARLRMPIPGEIRWIPWIYTNNFYVK